MLKKKIWDLFSIMVVPDATEKPSSIYLSFCASRRVEDPMGIVSLTNCVCEKEGLIP